MANVELDLVLKTETALRQVRELDEAVEKLKAKAAGGLGGGPGAPRLPPAVPPIDPKVPSTFEKAKSAILGVRTAYLATVAAAGGFVLALGSVISGTQRALVEMDALDEASQRVGIAVEALQELRFSFGLVGIGAEQSDRALETLTRRIGETASGIGRAKDTFAQFGISVLDSNGKIKDTEDVLREIANAISTTSSEAEIAKLAFDAMGPAGLKMVPALKAGAAGLDEVSRRARELGLVIDEKTVKSAGKLSDELETMQKVVDVQVTQALISLGPLILDIATFSANAAREIGGMVDALRSIPNRTQIGLENRAAEIRKSLAIPRSVDEDNILKNALLGKRDPSRIVQTDAGPQVISGAVRERLRQELAQIEAELAARSKAAQAAAEARRLANAASAGEGGPRDTVDPEDVEKLKTALRGEVEILRQTSEQTRELAAANVELQEALRTAGEDTEAIALAQERYRLTVDGINKSYADETAREAQAELNRLIEQAQTPAQQYAATVAEILRVTEAAGAPTEVLHQLLEQLGRDFQETVESTNDWRELQQLLKDAKTPAENYADEIERILELTTKYGVEQEKVNAILANTGAEFEQAQKAAQEAATDPASEEWADAWERAAQSASTAFQDLFTDMITGQKSVGDAFKEFAARAVAAILDVIAQMIILRIQQQLLGEEVFGGGGGMGGIGGFFKTFAMSFVSGLGGGIGGGIVGGGITGANNISTGLRFGSGVAGVAAEGLVIQPRNGGVPILTAEAGGAEAILPLRDSTAMRMVGEAIAQAGGRSGAGGAMPVNIRLVNNGLPVTIESSRAQMSDSGLDLEFAIKNVMVDDVERGGIASRTMGRRFRTQPPRSQV